MHLFVGTSGYSYKEWKGTFYPEDLPAKQMLHFYSRQFRSVEINQTFYRAPTASALEKWCQEVPVDFQFAIKAPQEITHKLRLKDASEPVSELLGAVSVLKNRLGPVLFQLPPFLKKDAALLREFLTSRPPGSRWTFEFRHQSWFDTEVFDLLRDNQTALCIAEDDNALQIPFVSTADWGYLRLRRYDYGDPELKSWARRVLQQKWKDAFIFFKHEETGKGPIAARRFIELAR